MMQNRDDEFHFSSSSFDPNRWWCRTWMRFNQMSMIDRLVEATRRIPLFFSFFFVRLKKSSLLFRLKESNCPLSNWDFSPGDTAQLISWLNEQKPTDETHRLIDWTRITATLILSFFSPVSTLSASQLEFVNPIWLSSAVTSESQTQRLQTHTRAAQVGYMEIR